MLKEETQTIEALRESNKNKDCKQYVLPKHRGRPQKEQ